MIGEYKTYKGRIFFKSVKAGYFGRKSHRASLNGC